MQYKSALKQAVAAITLSCTLSFAAFGATTADHNKEIIGYITNWDPWKSTNAGFPAKGVANHLNVDLEKFTILNYSFFGVAVDGSMHSGDHRNKNIYKASEVQAPAELLMSDIYSSWDYHLVFGELQPSYTLTEEAIAQGFSADGNNSWTHEAYGLSGQFPIPVKKSGGQPGIIEHSHNKGVKVMASIGGWSMCKHFGEMAADPVKRARFMNDVKRLMALGFDGIDLDWEYPGPYSGMNFTGTEADYGNFLTLVQEIRAEIGPDKLITAAFSADVRKLEGFDWVELDKYMDHYNMMTYDFNGGWSGISGHNAPVYPYPDAEVTDFNWDTLAQWMLNKGIQASKINMGMPFYGRGVVTTDPADLNSPTIKRDITIQPDGPISTAADFTHWKQEVYDGTPNYFFIEQNKAGWQEHFDEVAQVPYLVKSSAGKNYFLSYDNVESIGKKAQYVNDRSLGGAIVWTVAGDLECTGGTTTHSSKLVTCGQVNQPLANKINDVFATGCQGCPNINFVSPQSGDQFAPNSTITLVTQASDSDGNIVKVEFFANNLSLGSVNQAPYQLIWSNVAEGDYQITAIATDNANNTKATPAISISVNDDYLKPQVTYVSPTGSFTQDSLTPIELQANASTNTGVLTAVTFEVKNETLTGQVTGNGVYTANYTPTEYGVHSVTVTATNDGGYSQTDTNSFSISQCAAEPWSSTKVYTTEQVVFEGQLYQAKWWNQNQQPDSGQAWQFIKSCSGTENLPPVLSGLTPSNQTFDANTTIALAVTATDQDGDITSVDFYVNNNLVGQDSSAPYQASFTSAIEGQYALKAVATDNDGASSEIMTYFNIGSDVPPPCQADAWQAATVYNGGQRASKNGLVYQAKWWTQGDDPSQGNQWSVWFVPAECQ